MGTPVKALLDTSVVIAADIGPLQGDLAISCVTLAELNFGVLVAKNQQARAERLRRLLALQRAFHALQIDEAAAASYGQIAAAVAESGRNPRPMSMDLLIAATAHAQQARVYTRNADDFRGLDGLVEIVAV